MIKRVISFLLCFCLLFTASATVFGEDSFTFDKIDDDYAVLIGKVTIISEDRIKLSKISDELWSEIVTGRRSDYRFIQDPTNDDYFILDTTNFNESEFHDGDVIKAYFINTTTNKKSDEGEEIPRKLLMYQQYDKKIAIEDKVKFLETMEILSGYEDGELHLERNITRGEFTALVMKMYYDYDCSFYTGAYIGDNEIIFPFQDVPNDHWARKYIEIAHWKNIISGKSADTFSPDESITIKDCIAVLIKASADTGREQKTQSLSAAVKNFGGYPEGYIKIARDNQLITNQSPDRVATREDVVELLYNAYNHEPRFTYTYVVRKPVIYLYPEKEMNVNVNVSFDGAFTFTYPEYNNGWAVTVKTDGTLVSRNTEYPYLFWEGKVEDYKPVFDEGFLVSKKDTVSFLEEKLNLLGLNERERTDFITYWAPQLIKNDFNIIKFDTKEYASKVSLNIEPQPDSLIRVFMVSKAANGSESVKEQELSKAERKGFVAVEWGGAIDE